VSKDFKENLTLPEERILRGEKRIASLQSLLGSIHLNNSTGIPIIIQERY
jgi:hypothetical protein